MEKKAQKPYSYHVFLLPFQWKAVENPGRRHWDDDLESLLGSQWKPNRFSLAGNAENKSGETERYNEYLYFHDFTRSILYDFDPKFRKVEGQAFMRHFEFEPVPAYYEIKVHDRAEPYRLPVTVIVVNFYWMGVGMMSIRLENDVYPEPDDILRINQFGRRIYPRYLPLVDVQREALAEWINFAGMEREEFADYRAGSTIYQGRNVPPFPAFLVALFPAYDKLGITLLEDDRMFVHCIFFHDGEANRLQEANMMEEGGDAFLYKYIFVNVGAPHCADPVTYHRMLEDAVYRRWIMAGTVLGITRYSFVGLASEAGRTYYEQQFPTIYYKLVELALLQRAAILIFQEQVSRASGADVAEVGKDVEEMYQQYLRFRNKVCFHEVTAQEQGIELYDLLQKQMRIPADLEALATEVAELHEYASIIGEQGRNERLDLITRLGAAFLVPSFIGGFFGMNMFVEGNAPPWAGVLAAMVILPALALLVLSKRSGVKRWILLVVIALIVASLVVLALWRRIN